MVVNWQIFTINSFINTHTASSHFVVCMVLFFQADTVDGNISIVSDTTENKSPADITVCILSVIHVLCRCAVLNANCHGALISK